MQWIFIATQIFENFFARRARELTTSAMITFELKTEPLQHAWDNKCHKIDGIRVLMWQQHKKQREEQDKNKMQINISSADRETE